MADRTKKRDAMSMDPVMKVERGWEVKSHTKAEHCFGSNSEWVYKMDILLVSYANGCSFMWVYLEQFDGLCREVGCINEQVIPFC